MRGEVIPQKKLFYSLNMENMVGKEHPLREIKALTDEALSFMNGSLDMLYHDLGRPCIPPEQLLKALVLMRLYSIRSHRQLMEQIGYNFLYRWFLDLAPDAPVWDHSTFTANNERLARMSEDFLQSVVCLAEERGLLSNEHFTVDGTLIEACASFKSLEKLKESEIAEQEPPKPLPPKGGSRKRKSRNGWVDFHGETRSNRTHRSRTDQDARLYRKSLGSGTKLGYIGNHLMDNRKGLIVEVQAEIASGKAETQASECMLKRVRQRPGLRRHSRVGNGQITAGEDKGYDQTEHIKNLRAMKVTPHIAAKGSHGSKLLDGRTYCRPGYALSQRKRKLVEETIGWSKDIGGIRKVRHRGLPKVQTQMEITASAYNLVRIANISRKKCA